MKVVAINGSPKSNGNTSIVLKHMQEEFEAQGIEMEIIHVGNKAIHGCIACGKCYTAPNHECIFKDDLVNQVAQKMREADGIVLGSPVYFSGIAGTMKSFLDRVFYTSAPYFKNKVGAAFITARRTGGSDTFHQLCNYLIMQE
ncbi:flavodoxin family protein [Anaerosporobacter sp.]